MIFHDNPLVIWRIVLLLVIGLGCCVNVQSITPNYPTNDIELSYQCNDNGSAILEFPSEEVGKLTMYSLVLDEQYLWRICEEKQINESRQLLDPKCRGRLNQYLLRIFRNGGNLPSNSPALSLSSVPTYFFHQIACDNESENVHGTTTLSNRNPYVLAQFFEKFTIENVTFNSVVSFSNEINEIGQLNKPVTIEIEIKNNKSMFGEKSHLESCKLDITHVDGHVESVSILENSTVKPEFRAIEFQSEYTPLTEFNAAKYTVKFNSFVLQNLKPFTFNCRTCSNCQPVEHPDKQNGGKPEPRPLKLKYQCNRNGSVILEFPSQEVGNLITYSHISWNEWKEIKASCGVRRVTKETQLFRPWCREGSGYNIHIIRTNEDDKIAVNPDQLFEHYTYDITCTAEESRTVELSSNIPTSFRLSLILFNYSGYRIWLRSSDAVSLAEDVKLEVEVDGDDYGEIKSHFESCDVYTYGSPADDYSNYIVKHISTSLIKNYFLTREGNAINFRTKYTPKSGSQSAKYTFEFKTFAMRSQKEFQIWCKACKDCDLPIFTTPHCYDNDLFTLKFPSDYIGNTIVFSTKREGDFLKICGERLVNISTNLDSKCRQQDGSYELFALEHDDKSDSDILLQNSDMLPLHWGRFICGNGMTALSPVAPIATFKKAITIGNTTFHAGIDSNYLGDNHDSEFTSSIFGGTIYMDIEITDKNLFGEESHLTNCKLDIYHTNGQVESISILENSCLKPKYRSTEFRAEYMPSIAGESARYKINFKTFALRSQKPFYFNCQACKDCAEVKCPRHNQNGVKRDSRLLLKYKCNNDGSATLKFPSDDLGSLTMYTKTFRGNRIAYSSGERQVTNEIQELPRWCSENSVFNIHIFQNDMNDKVTVNPDQLFEHYTFDLRCTGEESLTEQTVELSPNIYPGFPFEITIWNQPKLSNGARGTTRTLTPTSVGEPVKLEIEVHENEFNENSKIQSCHMATYRWTQNYQGADGPKIYLVQNSVPTREGKFINFQTNFTPKNGSQKPKFTIEFTSFSMRSRKGFQVECYIA